MSDGPDGDIAGQQLEKVGQRAYKMHILKAKIDKNIFGGVYRHALLAQKKERKKRRWGGVG